MYLGIHPKTREKRAFKIFGTLPFTGPSAYANFMREVDAVRALSHPGIIRILDHGGLEDCCFYAMEHMTGGDLNRRIEHGRMPADEAVSLFLPVCAAIACAHDCGVMHRNLKPSNILFNDQGAPVVSDFGITRVLQFEMTPAVFSGEILGTIAYLAPEQRFNSKKVNRRADVYALGAILYEMLMGFAPLGNFPKPSAVLPGFAEPLQDILSKCLATDPEQRFDHAGQLQDELERCSNQRLHGTRIPNPAAVPETKTIAIGDLVGMPSVKSDRIESWFGVLRTGTTRDRLAVVREMVDRILPSEAKTIVKLYPEEGDRVRWGLIRVLGELKIEGASAMIMNDLRNSFHTECAIEALGKIGSDDAFTGIRDYIAEHPESAIIGLLPLARTGKRRAIQFIQNYLSHEKVDLRQAAVRALASIRSADSLQALKQRLCVECDESVKAALFQAVHSLQALLLPDVRSIQKAENLPVARNV